MRATLTDTEVRVLGSLVEKEITTPEYYPLSLNSLVTACNQKSNREPVVSYDETTVTAALDSLRDKGLAIVVKNRDSRVLKYDNYFSDFYSLSPQENAVMNVLMLRGPQTVGEVRVRSERLHDFSSLEEVEGVLEELAERQDGPFVVKLSRLAGQKESRWAHLLAGEVSAAETPATTPDVGAIDGERIAQLEHQVELLGAELDELRQQFADFRNQFE